MSVPMCNDVQVNCIQSILIIYNPSLSSYRAPTVSYGGVWCDAVRFVYMWTLFHSSFVNIFDVKLDAQTT